MKAKAFGKIIAVICAAVFVAAAAVVAYAAPPAPVFTVNGASQLGAGEEFTVTVSVNDNRGFCAGEFVLGYDSDVLTPIGVEGGEAASEYFVSNKDYDDGKVYFAVIDEQLMTDGGTLASITFRISEDIVLYNGDLTLSVPTLVGNISVGFGFNNVKSTANSGEIYAAKQIVVPDAVNPAVNEVLELMVEPDGYVLGATTFANLTQSALAANFSSVTAEFYSADSARLPATSLLSTGCKIKIIRPDNTSDELVMSVAGDVDGNCTTDANDAFLVGMFNSGLIGEDDIGSAYSSAADVNGDGVVNDADFNAAVNAPLN